MASPSPPPFPDNPFSSSFPVSSQQQDSQSQEVPGIHHSPPSSIIDPDENHTKVTQEPGVTCTSEEYSSLRTAYEPPIPSFSTSDSFREALRSTLTDSFDSLRDNNFSVTFEQYQSFLLELKEPTILSKEETKKIRYNYNPTNGLLTIRCMPTAVHDAILEFIIDMKQEMVSAGFLSTEESKCIKTVAGTNSSLPEMVIDGRKVIGLPRSKKPDAAYKYTRRGKDPVPGSCFPRVVFEVSFQAHYKTSKEYAEQWLVRSGGKVKLVVVINLDEQKSSKKVTKRKVPVPTRNGSTGMNLDLVRVQGESTLAEDNHGSSAAGHNGQGMCDPGSPTELAAKSSSPTLSTADDYERFYLEVDPTLWVRPISGFVELYRYNKSTNSIDQDGPRFQLYPESTCDKVENPRIKISDLLPDRESDKSSYPMPLNEYPLYVHEALRSLALERKINRQNKDNKRKQPSDSEYDPDEDNNGELVTENLPRRTGLRKRIRVKE